MPSRELDDWRVADEAKRQNERTDSTTHQRATFSDYDALSQRQRQLRIDQLYEDLEGLVNLSWVRRPWKKSPTGAGY